VGDVVYNPAQGIVDAVCDLTSCISRPLGMEDTYIVVFGEVYGGKITAAAQQYSGAGKVGFRLFDVADIPADVLTMNRSAIVTWRDNGG
jgi:hypothetical protein